MNNTSEEMKLITERIDAVHRKLTHTEFCVLKTLLANRGKLITPSELSHAIWDSDYYTKSFDKSLHVHMHNLRLKLKDAGIEIRIRSIRNKGYIIQ